MNTWKNAKHIAIWGYAREGRAAYEFLSSKNPEASFYVLSDTTISNIELPKKLRYSEDGLIALARGTFDLVIKSPGVSLYRKEILQAISKGTLITSTTNLWHEANPQAKTVAITGTKGKSTISSLLYHLLTNLKQEAVLAGNIGIPLLEQKPGRDITIIEMSSYQCADLRYPPNIFVISNLYPEHTNWHGTIERYYQDKLHPLCLSPQPLIIANAQNKELVTRLDGFENVYWFNDSEAFHIKDGKLYYRCTQLNLSFPLKGEHNLHNLACVLSILSVLKCDTEKACSSLSNFNGLPHRLQELGVINGRLCVDDSISTIPETTLAALEAYREEPITLIMGGQSRNQDYTALCSAFENFDIHHLFLLPENGRDILGILKKTNSCVPTSLCATLKEAVQLSFNMAPPESIIMLTPGAPSYGQFKDFRERGDMFAKLCGFKPS